MASMHSNLLLLLSSPSGLSSPPIVRYSNEAVMAQRNNISQKIAPLSIPPLVQPLQWTQLPHMRTLSISQTLTLAALISLTYLFTATIYKLYIHPLSRFPGPKLWAISRIPYMRAMQKGTLVHKIQRFHTKYGPTIRIGPNEISTIKSQAWQEIYGSHKPGHNFPKNPMWMSRKANNSNSILSANDTDHHRIRRLISHAFSEKALREQEPILQEHVGVLMDRLKDQVKAGWGNAVVDLVDWYSWTTFDIIGDLGFGETFNCLRDPNHHSWSSMVFSHFKAAALVTSVKFYPRFVERLLRWCLPSAVINRQGHFQLSKEKIHRRLTKGEGKKPDFMSFVLDPKVDGQMSLKEIETTFNILIIAGSETTASALAGTTGYLVKNPMCLATLVKEVRSSFDSEDKITLASLGKLPYLNACIEEGLRMAPPVPSGLPRVVPNGGATVDGEWLPGGTHISIPQYTSSHSPLHFHRPNSYLPERWLGGLSSHKTTPFWADNKAALQPFSYGPRNCIGKNLAYAELRLILGRMIWNFDLGMDKVGGVWDWKWEEQLNFVLVEKKPLRVRLGLSRCA